MGSGTTGGEFDGPLPVLDEGYVKAVQESLNAAVAEFSAEDSRNLFVYVVGEANVGKSSIINALLGADMAEVKAIAGWTKEAGLYEFAEHLYVVDTPGMNEVMTLPLGNDVPTQVAQQGDIILYVVNVTGNRSVAEREEYQKIRRLGRPMFLVANKMDDILSPGERAEVLDDLSRRFGITPADISAVSARTGEGIEALSIRIYQQLEAEGFGMLWAKNARHRDALIRNLMVKSAIAAAAVGASPLPFSDMIPLTAIQCRMWIKIAKIYGYDITQEGAKGIISSIATGNIGRGLFRQLIKVVGDATGIGAVASSAIAAGLAGSMTYGLGVAAQEYYKSSKSKSLDELTGTYRAAFKGFSLADARASQG